MGWLDIILGRKNSKTLKKVQKAASTVTTKSKQKLNPTHPKVEWQKSEKGNDTAEINGFRVTIFKQDDGWNYCIAEILDEEDTADGVADSPEFGEWFPTKTEAKKAALEEVS